MSPAAESEAESSCKLKDFIRLAREGKRLKAKVAIELTGPGCETGSLRCSDCHFVTSTYFLSRDFSFVWDEEETRVSKTDLLGYFFGSEMESVEADKMICRMANARLKKDYEFLREANIQVEEAFFDC